KCPSRLEIEHKLSLDGLLDGQLRWFVAPQNSCGKDASESVGICDVSAVARQSTSQHGFTPGVDGCNRVLRRKPDELITATKQERIRTNQHPTYSLLCNRCKCRLDVAFCACMSNVDFKPECARS